MKFLKTLHALENVIEVQKTIFFVCRHDLKTDFN